MNTANLQHPAQDYRAAMQAAAYAFLERHQTEHLADEHGLFYRAVQHLNLCMDVPTALAEQLVNNAHTQLQQSNGRMHLDISTSTGTMAVVRDPETGRTFAIPVALIVRHIISSYTTRPLA